MLSIFLWAAIRNRIKWPNQTWFIMTVLKWTDGSKVNHHIHKAFNATYCFKSLHPREPLTYTQQYLCLLMMHLWEVWAVNPMLRSGHFWIIPSVRVSCSRYFYNMTGRMWQSCGGFEASSRGNRCAKQDTAEDGHSMSQTLTALTVGRIRLDHHNLSL